MGLEINDAVANATEEHLSKWNKAASTGKEVREMCKSPGFKILKERLEARMADQRNVWLKADSAEAAEIIRLKATVYKEVFDIIARVIKEGDNANILLEKHKQIYTKNPDDK